MIERLRELKNRIGARDTPEDNREDADFKPLRILAAQLLLLTSVDIALDALSRSRADPGPPYPHGSSGPRTDPYSAAASWIPVLVAPLAAAAHLTRVLKPGSSPPPTTRLLNGAVVGAGTAGLVHGFLSSRRTGEPPSLTPLALASAGVLGLILEREERARVEERRELQRRASIVERFVPRRRMKIDKIVVHV
jgi:hypothetical protein